MKRRDFITGLFTGIALSYVGFKTKRYVSGKRDGVELFYKKKFKDYVEKGNFKSKDLYNKLREKNVITFTGSINARQIEKLAATDHLHSYNEFLYTETELQLFALSYLQHEKRKSN